MKKTISYHKHHQRGLAIVEFTIIASVMLIIFFALFEAGRYVYSLQMLNESTRRAARLAAVCPLPADINNNPVAESTAVVKVLPSGFTTDGNTPIVISYLAEDGNTSVTDRDEVWFVRASINVETTDYLFFNVFTSFNDSLTLPDYSTTLRAEGLGYGNSSDNCP